MDIDIEEKEKLWMIYQKENKGHLNIGTRKTIFWTYDKLLLNQIEARREIAELRKKLDNLKPSDNTSSKKDYKKREGHKPLEVYLQNRFGLGGWH